MVSLGWKLKGKAMTYQEMIQLLDICKGGGFVVF